MYQPAFLEAGDDLDFPPGRRPHPFGEYACVVAVAHGAGGDHADALDSVALGSAMEAAQHLERMSHGLRIEVAVAKNSLSQAGNFAILMQRNQAASIQFSNTQANGVGTDVYGSKNRHCLSGALRELVRSGGRTRLLTTG